ncbi:DUF6745 domain-containing protein [Actinocorallia longicatena]|uniref:DUF6745 domain-containing protein n=1 Tax=Actinocorallia longicatena TaxID=111803 RepID=UPI0031CE4B55
MRTSDTERRLRAAAIRDEWLGRAYACEPADRAAAEAAVSELYRLIGEGPPEFVWVPSPAAARPLLPAPVRLRGTEMPARPADWPVATRLAGLACDLRGRLDLRTGRKWSPFGWEPFSGRPTGEIMVEGVRDPLRQSVIEGLLTPLRTALMPDGPPPLDLAWRGQHDAAWVGYYDAWRRAGSIGYRPSDAAQLDLWAVLARSCGWWWPGEHRCVIAERTSSVRTEDLGGGRHRLHDATGPAVVYPDGWSVYSWHGTRVPAWVVEEPTAELISAEPNIEVRRCAIERLGWDTYIDQAGLRLVGAAPDPGNDGSELRLYDLPRTVLNRPARVLLVVNGSLERDGTRRRYGLGVPAHLDDPLAAAAWTYGLPVSRYAELARRT